MIYFRIGNWQLLPFPTLPVASCRFGLMVLNQQLGCESAKSRVGKGMVWLRVG